MRCPLEEEKVKLDACEARLEGRATDEAAAVPCLGSSPSYEGATEATAVRVTEVGGATSGSSASAEALSSCARTLQRKRTISGALKVLEIAAADAPRNGLLLAATQTACFSGRIRLNRRRRCCPAHELQQYSGLRRRLLVQHRTGGHGSYHSLHAAAAPACTRFQGDYGADAEQRTAAAGCCCCSGGGLLEGEICALLLLHGW